MPFGGIGSEEERFRPRGRLLDVAETLIELERPGNSLLVEYEL